MKARKPVAKGSEDSCPIRRPLAEENQNLASPDNALATRTSYERRADAVPIRTSERWAKGA
jgi:hypothetical protein